MLVGIGLCQELWEPKLFQGLQTNVRSGSLDYALIPELPQKSNLAVLKLGFWLNGI